MEGTMDNKIIECPKCGQENDFLSIDCVKCGIVFSKFYGIMAREETDDEKRRNREAKARREARLTEKRREEACQQDAESCEP